MLLVIDIGNTDTVIGVYENDQLIDFFRVASNHTLTVDECGFFVTGLMEKLKVKSSQLKQVVIASVVPRLKPVYEKMSNKYLNIKPLIVSSEVKLPIKIGYENPKAVGADRIANAVAAYTNFDGPIIVVDFGTATTFDVIDKNGVYLGGAIAPGPETSGRELVKKAARLFDVNIERPKNVIGRNTAESIKSGLFYGTIGLVDSIIERIQNELEQKAKVVATGGLAADFSKDSRYIESVNKVLTLEGLKIIADFQAKS